MGFGDELIVTSIAKRAFQKLNRPLRVGDGINVRWSEVFDHNPKLSKTDGPWIKAISGNRPYIDYAKSTPDGFAWNYDYRVEPGELFFSPDELRHEQSGFIYVEPNVKGSFGGNKDWGFWNWQSVVDRIPARWIQGRGNKLEGVEQVATRSFRDACALLSRASLFVGTDGGMHHAAAALGIPAVVVWGGLAPPSVLGYSTHTNLCAAHYWCGSFTECQHCRKAMHAVSVDDVVQAIRARIEGAS